LYNKDKNDFEYYVQRLIGVGISDETAPSQGKIWVPYINALREDWSYICENNRLVSKDDEIVFRYEPAFLTPAKIPGRGGGTNSPSNTL
jgi:hypothetical protein